MREFVATLLALVLPAPEREFYERQSPLDVAFWSLLVGIAELFGSFFYLVDDYLATLPKLGEMIAGGAAAEMGARALGSGTYDERVAYNLSGAMNVWAWYFQPHVMFFFLVAIAGGARIVAFLVTRQPLGEPLAYLALRLGQAFRRKAKEGKHQLALGPERPDRFLPGEGADRWLLSARSRPDWQVGFSVEIAGEIYQIAAIELKQPEGESGNVYFYHLREQPPGQLIRRLVAYEPR